CRRSVISTHDRSAGAGTDDAACAARLNRLAHRTHRAAIRGARPFRLLAGHIILIGGGLFLLYKGTHALVNMGLPGFANMSEMLPRADRGCRHARPARSCDADALSTEEEIR